MFSHWLSVILFTILGLVLSPQVKLIHGQCDANIATVAPAAQLTYSNTDYHIQTSKNLNTNNAVVVISGMLDVFSAVSVVNWLDLKATGTAGVYTPPSTSSTITLISTSANDAAAGTGCRTVLIEGLDAAGAVVSNTVTMNGVAATAATSNTFSFVNRMTCATVGTGLVNAGVISLNTGPGAAANRPVIGLTNAAHTAFGVSRSTGAAYRVPSGQTLILTSIEVDAYRAATTAGTFSGVVWIKYTTATGSASILLDRVSLDIDGTNSYTHSYELSPIRLPAGATIWAEGMWEVVPTPTMISITGVLYS